MHEEKKNKSVPMMAMGLMSAVTIMSEAARFTMKMSPTI